MKSMVILEAVVIVLAILGTAAVAIERGITPQQLISLIGDLHEDVAREVGETVEETTDIVINTITHQIVTPPLTMRAARSVTVEISELVCEVYEDARYNDEISHLVVRDFSPDKHFKMWMAANTNISAIIDIAEIDIDVDSLQNEIEITVPAPYFGDPRIVDFQASISEASHLSNEESSEYVVSSFLQHIRRARSQALDDAVGGTMLEDVKTDFTVRVSEMLSDIYPGVSVTVMFASEEDNVTDEHDQRVFIDN